MKSIELSNSFYLSKSFTLSASLYKNVLDEAIVKEFVTNNIDFSWINQGRFETEGTEVTVNYSAKKIKLSTNYTYNFSYDEDREVITEIAKHTANAMITYRIFDHFSLNLRANYFGKRKNPQSIATTNSNFVAPALVFNGALSLFDFHKFDAQIIVKNILDTEYYHTSNETIDRYRQPQRTLLIKMAYNF